MTLLFILSTRELGSSLFLYSTGSMVMSVQLLNYYEGGNMSITAAYSLIQMLLLGGVIGLGQLVTRKSAGSVGHTG
jgi:iron(III) transport system permease protein